PMVYAGLLGERIAKHNASVYLVNTGWTGGPYGVGRRMSLPYTRAMVRAALNGDLDKVEFAADPVFGILVPAVCPGVPAEILNPRHTWAEPQKYDAMARKLAGLFRENFAEFRDVPENVRDAGPVAG
ncbi:MAG: phosphoenolpyruvate carboxykinase (ATP), partial [Bacillota bacterium]